MFTPRYVIRDKRSLLRKTVEFIKQNVLNHKNVVIPHNQICVEYVSRTTKTATALSLVAMFTFVSAAVYDTVYPSYDKQPFSISVQIPDNQQTVVVQQPKTSEPISKHHDLSVAQATEGNKQKHLTCLAKNIYFEARSESLRGHIAVGLVTINRVADQRFPDTICDVVWQDKQFSWTHDGLSDQPKQDHSWEQSKNIAQFMLSNGTVDHIVDFTDGATHYHADYVSPYWNKQYLKTATVGAHLFYRTDV